jgi:hypothetical protein
VCTFVLSLWNGIARSEFLRWGNGGCVMMMSGKLAQEAAAALLRFSKSTSDPRVAAALIAKAADIVERAERSPLISDRSPRAPDVVQATEGGGAPEK